MAALTAACLGEVIDSAPTSLAAPTPQPEDGVIYAAKITSDDAMIDWQKPASALDYHIRAFAPYPGAWCGGPKGRLRILDAHPVLRPAEHLAADAGQFLGKYNKNSMLISCGNDALAITRLQPAGKNAMSATDFLNGAGLKIGDHLKPEIGVSNS